MNALKVSLNKAVVEVVVVVVAGVGYQGIGVRRWVVWIVDSEG